MTNLLGIETNKIHEVTIDNIVTDFGMADIKYVLTKDRFLTTYSADRVLENVGNQFVTRQGKITKRISKYIYKEFGYSISDKDIELIGNIAANNSKAGTWRILVSFDPDVMNVWNDRTGHGDQNINYNYGDSSNTSCYRPGGEYHSAFLGLRDDNRSFIVKLLGENEETIGRLWGKIVDNDESEKIGINGEDNMVIVFNAYGEKLETYSAMLTTLNPKIDYKKITVSSRSGYGLADLWINSSSGCLLTRDKKSLHTTLKDKRDFRIAIPESEESDSYNEDHSYCEFCEDVYHYDDMTVIDDRLYCQSCVDYNFTMCSCCNEYTHDDNVTYANNQPHCETCLHDNFTYCDCCGEFADSEDVTAVNYDSVCSECLFDHYHKCTECGEYHNERESYTNPTIEYNDLVDDPNMLCEDCYNDIKRAVLRKELLVQKQLPITFELNIVPSYVATYRQNNHIRRMTRGI